MLEVKWKDRLGELLHALDHKAIAAITPGRDLGVTL